jgi:signal transduction histidine kinase
MTDTPAALILLLALGAVTVVLTLQLVRTRRELSRSRLRSEAFKTQREGASQRNVDLGARLRAVEAELRHLVNARIPDLAPSLNNGSPVRGPLGTAPLSPDVERSIDAVLTKVTEEVAKERRRVDLAAQAALRSAATTIQALLYQQQSLMQRMQEKYDDPLVAEDLLSADFLNEQALRRVQSTAVVCGAWPGLTRENSHLGDIVVGAMSRLRGYERIQFSSHLRDPVGVVARAVEPVAVALTELMANALYFSHPELPVVVTLQQGNRGISVIIDDAGVGMHSDEVARAKRLMSGEDALLITELGDPPRNGFAAIGRLVRQYGFNTHTEVSPYGGVRAVMHIPAGPLLTLLDENKQPMSAMTPTPPEGAPAPRGPVARKGERTTPVPGVDVNAEADVNADADVGANVDAEADADARADVASEPEREAEGEARKEPEAPRAAKTLPRRRRQVPEPTRTAARTPAAPPSTPEESAKRWSALRQGTDSGRAAAAALETDERQNDEAAPPEHDEPDEPTAETDAAEPTGQGDNTPHEPADSANHTSDDAASKNESAKRWSAFRRGTDSGRAAATGPKSDTGRENDTRPEAETAPKTPTTSETDTKPGERDSAADQDADATDAHGGEPADGGTPETRKAHEAHDELKAPEDPEGSDDADPTDPGAPEGNPPA